MRYELKAIAPGGHVESLDFQAPDQAAAVKSLEGRGYHHPSYQDAISGNCEAYVRAAYGKAAE